MKNIFLVGAGGFIGANLRYILSMYIDNYNRFTFPFSTLSVNFIGCFALGYVIGLDTIKTINIALKQFVLMGILGGFTTFSAFGLESFNLIKSGNYKLSMLYILSSIVLSLLGILIGSFYAK